MNNEYQNSLPVIFINTIFLPQDGGIVSESEKQADESVLNKYSLMNEAR